MVLWRIVVIPFPVVEACTIPYCPIALSCTDKQSSTHDFDEYIKVLPSYLLHNVMQYFLGRAVTIESQVKQKNLQCFWYLPLYLLQLPIATTLFNVIRLHVSVLDSHSNFIHVSDNYVYTLASGMLYD